MTRYTSTVNYWPTLYGGVVALPGIPAPVQPERPFAITVITTQAEAREWIGAWDRRESYVALAEKITEILRNGLPR